MLMIWFFKILKILFFYKVSKEQCLKPKSRSSLTQIMTLESMNRKNFEMMVKNMNNMKRNRTLKESL